MRVLRLNAQQKGRLAETIAKAAFLSYGLEVFEPAVDDRGIDLLIRLPQSSRIYEVQVKGVTKYNYAYLSKKHIDEKVRSSRFVCFILLDANPSPELFLIPLSAWSEEDPVFRIKNYEKPGQKSKPEYGINASKKNYKLLSKYKFKTTLKMLFQQDNRFSEQG